MYPEGGLIGLLMRVLYKSFTIHSVFKQNWSSFSVSRDMTNIFKSNFTVSYGYVLSDTSPSAKLYFHQ
jgi:hypothetical protein